LKPRIWEKPVSLLQCIAELVISLPRGIPALSDRAEAFGDMIGLMMVVTVARRQVQKLGSGGLEVTGFHTGV